MTTREHHPPGSDRERRAELEALQVELREAKAALALAQTAEHPELAHLREAVVQAGERRARALTRRRALEDERVSLEEQLAQLKLELGDEQSIRRKPLFTYSSGGATQPQPAGNPGVSLLILLLGAAVFLLLAAASIVRSCVG